MSKIITDIDQLDLKGSYTYADYLLWQFQERVELIKGKIFKMSPAPSSAHQSLSWNLMRQIDKAFYKTSGKMYAAPFDVRLINFKKSGADNQIISVVQPDLCVICDRNKIDEKGCLGAPDLIIEILSKGNSKKDLVTKFDLYQENGVQEYWIVNPSEKDVHIYTLSNGKYIGSRPYLTEMEIESPTFPELKFEVDKIFEL
jgi:Uma2 family endonuclease